MLRAAAVLLLPAAVLFSQTLETRQSASAPASASGHSAISGVVTDGATGRPIAGALVALSDPKAKTSVGMATDSKGRFVFAGLPASFYNFRVEKAGYFNTGKGQNNILLGSTTRLDLAEGEWRRNEDVVLWPYGSISGRVVDEQGESVIGVPVRVLTRISVGGTDRWVVGPMWKTDDRGIYRIERLRGGAYIVQLPNVQSSVPLGTTAAVIAGRPPGYNGRMPAAFGLDFGATWLAIGAYAIPPSQAGRQQAYPAVFYPGSRSLASAVPVDLAYGEHKAAIDFALRPVPIVSISGRVSAPPDASNGLLLRLFPADDPVNAMNGEVATALVSKDGEFTMLGVPTGQYVLVAAYSTSDLRLPDGGDAEGTVLNTPGLRLPTATTSGGAGGVRAVTFLVPESSYYGSTAVAVGSEDVSDVVLTLHAAAVVSGRVVQESGAPFAEVVNVRVSGTGNPTLMAPFVAVRPNTDPSGHFSIRGLANGQYWIDANVPTKPSHVVKSVFGPGGDYTNRPVQITAGADLGDVVVTMTDRSAMLSGIVHDRDGAVSNHASVALFPADSSQWIHFGINPPGIHSTLALGKEGYSFSRLRAGEYLAIATSVSPSLGSPDARFFEAASARATRVTLGWGESTVVNLTLQSVVVR
jgi:hypothetical protein